MRPYLPNMRSSSRSPQSCGRSKAARTLFGSGLFRSDVFWNNRPPSRCGSRLDRSTGCSDPLTGFSRELTRPSSLYDCRGLLSSRLSPRLLSRLSSRLSSTRLSRLISRLVSRLSSRRSSRLSTRRSTLSPRTPRFSSSRLGGWRSLRSSRGGRSRGLSSRRGGSSSRGGGRASRSSVRAALRGRSFSSALLLRRRRRSFSS
mmetsp:Transcript_11846/g.23324  ORF Transcript_11846/g.23324 Transcript_11846/m.23324 type:complete len:202 (-) Transcript_11846:153-758(-)